MCIMWLMIYWYNYLGYWYNDIIIQWIIILDHQNNYVNYVIPEHNNAVKSFDSSNQLKVVVHLLLFQICDVRSEKYTIKILANYI